jgi:glycosyltransferase involved in cell wall biosynthesis
VVSLSDAGTIARQPDAGDQTFPRILLFTASYNERNNIGRLVDEMAAVVPSADILVIDDNSPDGTWAVLEEKQRQHEQLRAMRRPRKLGIGSAHKYALFYAMREGYDFVVTMDADFSHDPASIPDLLAKAAPGVFVTGSRYCQGGRAGSHGFRSCVSRVGNAVARRLLGVELRELTTYFRVFHVDSLRALPFRHIDSDGYSYGMQLIFYLDRVGLELREVPIDFGARAAGSSKIPKSQLIRSGLNLMQLVRYRLTKSGPFYEADLFTDDPCVNCGQPALAMSASDTLKCLHCLTVQPAPASAAR